MGFGELVAPLAPVGAWFPGKEFQVRGGAALFDEVVEFLGFAGVAVFSGQDDVFLAASGVEGAQPATYAEEYHFGHVAKVEAHSPAVRAAVSPYLVPHQY